MAATSSLSALSRTPTPFSRYHTADEGTEGASNPAGDVTDISSPGDVDADAHAGADDDFGLRAPYHAAQGLPRELKIRAQIHLEEQTYVTALNLLNSLLCDNISNSNVSANPVHVPPPALLGVLATLAIQPKHTSRLANADAHSIASQSLSYLRDTLATAGPINANLRNAFLFRGDGGRRRRSSDDFTRHGSESDEDHVRGSTANAGSVWTRGQDFWNVLGWALNCSALYPHRWRWWKPWLEFMLDVLEADYGERRRLDREREGEKDDNEDYEYQLLQDSLLVSYITPKNNRSSPLKPIMSALFADGGPTSITIYNEVFKNETRVASKSSKKRKRHHVDLDNDNFGDYDDDSSTGGSEPPTPEHQRTSAKKVDDSVPWTGSSLVETIPLRLRLFGLLSQAGYDVPARCNLKLTDLYETFVEKITRLPVPAFEKFIAAHNSPLEGGSLVAIIRLLMPKLLPSSIPQPKHVDPDADEDESSSDRILERCYLPFAYRTAENNAKISLATETLFRIMWTRGALQWAPSLQQAVEKGVQARKDKSAPKKRKDDGESAARDTLRASGKRLLALVSVLQLQASITARR